MDGPGLVADLSIRSVLAMRETHKLIRSGVFLIENWVLKVQKKGILGGQFGSRLCSPDFSEDSGDPPSECLVPLVLSKEWGHGSL